MTARTISCASSKSLFVTLQLDQDLMDLPAEACTSDASLADVVMGCLHPDPACRLTASQANAMFSLIKHANHW